MGGSSEQNAYVPKISLRPHVPLRGCNRRAKWDFGDVCVSEVTPKKLLVQLYLYGSDDFEAPYKSEISLNRLKPSALAAAGYVTWTDTKHVAQKSFDSIE